MSPISDEKYGLRSEVTLTWNDRDAASPSASVAVQVYCVRADDPLGVPLTRWLALFVTPLGRDGLSA